MSQEITVTESSFGYCQGGSRTDFEIEYEKGGCAFVLKGEGKALTGFQVWVDASFGSSWQDVPLADAPSDWEEMVSEAESAYAESQYEGFLESFYGGSGAMTQREEQSKPRI
jgi:hypothetical protein